MLSSSRKKVTEEEEKLRIKIKRSPNIQSKCYRGGALWGGGGGWINCGHVLSAIFSLCFFLGPLRKKIRGKGGRKGEWGGDMK